MTASTAQLRWAGPFMEGEIPLPFTVQYDKRGIDFSQSTFELAGTLEDEDGTELTFTGNLTWADEATGVVQVELAAGDVTRVGTNEKETRRLVIWTGDGTNRVATLLIKYVIDRPVGTPPSI